MSKLDDALLATWSTDRKLADDATEELVAIRYALDGYRETVAALTAERDALRAFADRYGRHMRGCPNEFKRECDCGFNQDRAALRGDA
jgi:hypothetical protein